MGSEMLFAPYFILVLFGLMQTQTQLLKGCDSAVEDAKNMVRKICEEKSNGVAADILKRACDPTDLRSYYPIIISSEQINLRKKWWPREYL